MLNSRTSWESNMFFLTGFSIISAVLLHFIIKTIFGGKRDEEPVENEKKSEAAKEKQDGGAANAEGRTNLKNKKRGSWKTKTEFTHPWLMKNLKGHPGTVLMVDFSANGKFMAATCDESIATVESPTAAAPRRSRQRDRRRPPPPAAPSPPSPSSLTLPIDELMEALQPHILSPKRMWTMGYPIELKPKSSKAVVYINPPPRSRPLTMWDVNAPEFVPGGGSLGDSGRGSWGSTPRSDSDEEADVTTNYIEHLCVRCDKTFKMTREGEYFGREACVYHWGRINGEGQYSCCRKSVGLQGCTPAWNHVWNGTRPGMNGPIEGYVRARSSHGGVYAIDTEMCYTTAGLELASVAVVGVDGRLKYKAMVKPSSPVIDPNTRFSGIRPRDLARATKTLRDVQNDLLGFIGSDTILIGHSLDNDMRALKLFHNNVVDTCDLYPHSRGFPLRRSLRALTKEYLGRDIQQESTGHSPLEDAVAALDLVLLKVRQEKMNGTPYQAQKITTQTQAIYVERSELAFYLHRMANRSPQFIVPVLEPYDPLLSAA